MTLFNRSKGKPLDSPAKLTHDWYATDSWPICHRQLTDISPTVDRYTTDIWPIFGRGASTKYRPILGRWFIALSTEYRSTLDRLSTTSRSIVDRLSMDSRSTIERDIDRVSTDIAVDITYNKHGPLAVAMLRVLKRPLNIIKYNSCMGDTESIS